MLYETAWQSENNHKTSQSEGVQVSASHLASELTLKKGISTPHRKRVRMAAFIMSWKRSEIMKRYVWKP